MRYRDCPTVEVTERMTVTPERAWAAVTDIALPVRTSPELTAVAWLDGATEVAEGARFSGTNVNAALGEWTTLNTVVEVEPGRRWVWEVSMEDVDPWSRWGFEVDPVRDGCVVRQWFRMGPNPSGLTLAIESMPDREARIVEVRLAEHRDAMSTTLATLRADLEAAAPPA